MIPKDSGRKENWYIRFITLCMSNFNIPENKSSSSSSSNSKIGGNSNWKQNDDSTYSTEVNQEWEEDYGSWSASGGTFETVPGY